MYSWLWCGIERLGILLCIPIEYGLVALWWFIDAARLPWLAERVGFGVLWCLQYCLQRLVWEELESRCGCVPEKSPGLPRADPSYSDHHRRLCRFLRHFGGETRAASKPSGVRALSLHRSGNIGQSWCIYRGDEELWPHPNDGGAQGAQNLVALWRLVGGARSAK